MKFSRQRQLHPFSEKQRFCFLFSLLFDFELAETPAPAHADVCIAGAGAAGIVLACGLARQGLTVTLLEGGGPRLERRSQSLYESETVGHPNRGIHDGRYRTYGGTTTEWGGQIGELDAPDFEKRVHVDGSGWPFPKSQLRPYYDQAIRYEGFPCDEPDTAAERAALLQTVGLPFLSLEPDLAMPLSRWCPVRNFAVLHRHALETPTNVSVYLHSNVVELVTHADHTAIRAVRIRTFGGRESLVTANQFVLCMGGIETTRLLCQPALAGTFPWQVNGVLGTFYKDHIRCDGVAVRSRQVKTLRRYFGMMSSKRLQYQTKLQLSFPLQRRFHTLNVAGSITPQLDSNPAREEAARDLRRLRSRSGEFSSSHILRATSHLPAIALNWMQHRMNDGLPAWRRTMLRVHCEQLPLSSSRINLSGDRDALGMLRTRLDWHISTEELHSIRSFVKVAAEVLPRHGLGHVEPPEAFFHDDAVVRDMCRDSNHHMGTTRMSDSANDGIVDPNLRLHGTKNAYVCSASVFPTTGFSNPTHTVIALALRLADRLKIKA